MPQPPKKNLGQLTTELSTRLGYGAQSASVAALKNNLQSMIINAQFTLYELCDFAALRKYWDATLAANAITVAYPDECNPEKLHFVSVLDGGVWSKQLDRGIRPELYTTQDNKRRPTRYERYEALEFWPRADKEYTVRLYGIKHLTAFNVDADQATIDDRLIFTLALADAKDHYKHADAAKYTARADALLLRLKASNWHRSVYMPDHYDAAAEPLAKPVVI